MRMSITNHNIAEHPTPLKMQINTTTQPTSASLQQAIKQYAHDCGFQIVGFTSAEAFERDEAAAIQRIRDGLMDGLHWYTEERVRRANRPKLLLDGALSVISLAMSYNTAHIAPDNDQPRGKIARYAWGDDYHKVIKARLRTFAEGLSDIADQPVKTRIFVDDGPMNDRAAAARSGIGWFGKNTNILTPSHGSWVFLAQVITDLPLEADSPLKKTCGSCTLCIDDCPTGAIVSPYVLDNTRCISYLTIELRGSIPRKLRALVGDWVFGCDICQDVCPVNRKAEQTLEAAFQQRHDFAAPALIPLLALDDEAFRERFRHSPVKRTKRIGLQRNVCVALGNIGDAAAIPALTDALQSQSHIVRSHAAWALGRIGGEDAASALKAALSTENEPQVIEEIQHAISELEDS